MKEFDEIDDMFAQEFENFSVTPPAHVKSNIDKAIYKRKFPFGWVLLSLIVTGCIVFLIQNGSDSNNEIYVQSDSKSNLVQEENEIQKLLSKNQTENREAPWDTDKKTTISESLKVLSKEKVSSDSKTSRLNNDKITNVKNGINGDKNGNRNLINKDIKNKKSDTFNNLGGQGIKSTTAGTGLGNKPNSFTLLETDEVTQGIDSMYLSPLPYMLSSNLKSRDIVLNEIRTSDSNLIKKYSWQASIRSAVLLGDSKNLKDTTKPSLILLNGYGLNLELAYTFQNQFILGGGMLYQSNKFVVRKPVYEDYSFPTGASDTTWVIDPNDPDSNFIEIVTPIYQTDSVLTSKSSVYRLNAMSFPLFFGKQFTLTDHFGLNMYGGMCINYHSLRAIGNSSLTNIELNKWGFQGMFRPEIIYRFQHWSLSSFVNLQYNFIDPIRVESLVAPKYRLSFGFGVHYLF
jgi:hypothetical protein